MSAAHQEDEFGRRIRDLEAERMRPVPKRPKPPLEVAADNLLHRLRRTYEAAEEVPTEGPASVDEAPAAKSTGRKRKSPGRPQVSPPKSATCSTTDPQDEERTVEVSEDPSVALQKEA